MDIAKVKEANPIEDVIGETFPLRGRGRYLRAEAHDSLVVDVHKQYYVWNSQGEDGDVIEWLVKRENVGFKEAVERLCRRAHLPEPQWSQRDGEAAVAARVKTDALTVAARFFVRRFRESAGARKYCQSRGWTDEAMREAGLGFAAAGFWEDLRGELELHGVDAATPAVQAVKKVPAGMLVYPHVEYGRVAYLSARSIEEKRHYNLEAALAGDRRLYFNWLYSPRENRVVVVEGQADAITLGQWGIPAVALAGVAVNQDVLKILARHKHVTIALDNDEAGHNATRKLADALNPTTQVTTWPEDAHDANGWLQKGATAEDCKNLLAAAPSWAMVLAGEVAAAENGTKASALRRAFMAIKRLDRFEVASQRKELAEAMGIRLQAFDQMLKESKSASEGDGAGQDEVLIAFSATGGIVDGHFLEMIYEPPKDDEGPTSLMTLNAGKSLFAIRYPDGHIEVKPFFDHDGIRYTPLPANLPILREKAVIFAPRVGDPMSTREVLERIREVIHRYVDVDEFYEALASYYVLSSWFYDVFDTLSYLRVIGDAGTGKSRFLQVMGNLCFRPINMNAGASTSSMFRLMDMVRGTLILDEGDFASSDETTDIAKMLNVGYQRRQGYIYRSGNRDKDFQTELFVVYGPKVISTRKDFEDNAIRSRCLTKEMGAPTTRKDIPDNLPDTFWNVEVPEMQATLLRFRFDHWSPEINDRPVEKDMSVEPRLRQVTASLMKIIGDDPEMKEELQAFIKQYTRQMIIERGLQIEAKILEAMYVQYELEKGKAEKEQDFSLGTLAGIANDLMDYENETDIAHWSRYQEKERNRGISSRGAGRCVDNLQLHKERRGTRRRYHIIWDHERIEALWRRYGLGDDESRSKLFEVYWEIQREIEEYEQRIMY